MGFSKSDALDCSLLVPRNVPVAFCVAVLRFECDKDRRLNCSKGKKEKTRNCTQYCLAWVFLPFAHVVY